MAVVTVKQLLEAGAHFGHTTKRWNPLMKPYIFGRKNGIYVLDLNKTAEKLEDAYKALLQIIKEGGQIIFVGTKKQAQDAVKEAADRTGQYFVAERWLGGTLTNFKTIKNRIKFLNELIEKREAGEFEQLSKKQQAEHAHIIAKLEKNLDGIRTMKRVPDALFVVDPSKEFNAVREAKKVGIPVFAIVDTNSDPRGIDYVIPANDDATRSVQLIINVLTNAVVEGQGGVVEAIESQDDIQFTLDAVEIPSRDERKYDSRFERPARKPKFNRERQEQKQAEKPAQSEEKVAKPAQKTEKPVKPAKVEKPAEKSLKPEVKPQETKLEEKVAEKPVKKTTKKVEEKEVKAEAKQEEKVAEKLAKKTTTKKVLEEIPAAKVEKAEKLAKKTTAKKPAAVKVEKASSSTGTKKVSNEIEGSTSTTLSVFELETKTLADLKNLAKALGLKGYSALKKVDLIQLILNR